MIVSVGTRRAAVGGDEPTASFGASRVLREATAVEPGEAPGNPARCVVEILRRGGGLMPRALLGGVYTPGGENELVIEVGSSGSSLAGAPTCVSQLWRPLVPGLPDEFALPSVDGLLRSALPPGLVVLDRAAFDPVESSPLAFELVAELLAIVLGAMSTGQDIEKVTRAAIEAWP